MVLVLFASKSNVRKVLGLLAEGKVIGRGRCSVEHRGSSIWLALEQLHAQAFNKR